MSKPIIALDMDGVIADWVGAVMLYVDSYGIDTIADLNKFPLRNEIIDNIYKNNPFLFENLNLVECSMPLLDYLNNGVKFGKFDLVIATHTVNGIG